MNLWKTVGLLVAAGLLTTYWYFFERKPPVDREADRQICQLLGFDDAEDITEITVTRPSGSFTVRRDGTGSEFDSSSWSLTAPLAEKCDTAATSFFRTLATTKARFAYGAEQAKDIPDATTGLGEPEFALTLADATGRKATLQFGQKAANDGGYYARVEGRQEMLIFFGYFVDTNLKDKKLGDLRDKTLLSFDTAAVKTIKLVYPGTTVELEKTDDEWRLKGDKPRRADQTAVESLLSSLSGARIDEFVEEQNPDLQSYGLAEPRLEVILGLGDKGENGLLLGTTTTVEPDSMEMQQGAPPTEKLYVQRKGGADVYLVAGTLYDQLRKNPTDLRDKTVFAVDQHAVTKIAYTIGGESVELTKDGATTPASWKLVKPAEMPADRRVAEDVVSTLELLRATDFVDAPADLKAYGLDKPAATITVEQSAKEPVVVLVGRKSADGNSLFVQRQGAPEVIQVRGSFLDDLPTKPNRLRDLQVVKLDRTLVSSIAIRQKNAGLVRLEPTGGEAWKVVEPEEQEADSGRVGVVLTALEDLHADEWVADKAADVADYGLDKPDVTVTVRWKEGGKEQSMTLYLAQDPAGGLGVFVKVKGRDTIYKSDSGLLLSDLKKGPDDFKPFEQPDFGGMGMPPM